MHRRPDGFRFPHAGLGRAGRVIHHVHQATARTALFQPVMETSVQLHQLAKVRLAFATLAVFLRAASPTPQPRFQHPAAQGLVIDPDPVFFGQVLGRQSRTETLALAAGILALDQAQHAPSQLRGLAPIRLPPGIAMLQTFSPALPIPPPHPLRLPVA